MPQTLALKPLGPVVSDVRGAQLALDALWDQTEIESRAYTGNLIALTEKKHLVRVQEALATIGGRYAGRQIVGVMDGDDTVDVEVSLVPQRGLYVERLVLDANAEQLQGAILPLLRPATMNHLWWASNTPPGGALLQELAEIADQVIADTLALHLHEDVRFALSDLGWARTSVWREATAQLFDAPEAAAQLRRLTRLRVSFAGSNDRPARLFAGWVASKLGWLSAGGVEIAPEPGCQRENGDLCGVTLSGPAENGASFELRGGEGYSVRTTVRYGSVEHSVESSLPPLSLGEGLGQLMARPAQNDNFEDALKVARRLKSGNPA